MKKQAVGFLRSFQHAARGLKGAAAGRSFRFHAVFLLFALYFAVLLDFSPVEFAVLFAFAAIMLGLEALNTALEYLCDYTCGQYSPVVKAVKDIAAGGVLAAALCAVAAGIFLFFVQDARGALLLAHIAQRPVAALWAPLAALPIGLYFIFK